MIDHQGVSFPLADSAADATAGRLLGLEVARLCDAGADPKLVHAKASVAKLFCSEAANRCADRCLQVFGGRGYMRTNVAERFWRELRVDRIWEGTSEIQRLVIARSLERRGVERVLLDLTRAAAAALGRRRRRHRAAGLLRRRGAAEPARGSASAGRVHARQPAPRAGARLSVRARRSRDLPEAPDAVVVAIPADGAPERRRGGRRARLRRRGRVRRRASPRRAAGAELQARARRGRAAHDLPVCGPNGNGIVSLRRARGAVGRHGRAARGRARSRSSPRAATSPSTRSRRGAGCGCTRSSRAATRRCSTRPTTSSALAGARRRALDRAVPRGRRRRRALVRGARALRGAPASAWRCSRPALDRRGRGGRAGAHRRGGRRPARVPRVRRGGRRGVGARPARAARAGQGAGALPPRRRACRAAAWRS